LLKDLIKHTAENHPDYENLQTAFETIKRIASHINDAIKEAEDRKKMIEIQNSFETAGTVLPFGTPGFVM
jgi:hypothetical protein